MMTNRSIHYLYYFSCAYLCNTLSLRQNYLDDVSIVYHTTASTVVKESWSTLDEWLFNEVYWVETTISQSDLAKFKQVFDLERIGDEIGIKAYNTLSPLVEKYTVLTPTISGPSHIFQ